MRPAASACALVLLAASGLTTAASRAGAETLRWARAGDALTLDPHARNEGPTLTLAHQIMEPLVNLGMESELVPALATEWSVSSDDPDVWVFTLRDGVTFHDGAEFTSEDVKFSLDRAMSPNSDFKELLASVVEVRAPAPLTVEIVTNAPNPIMPANLTNLLILDKDWAEANGAFRIEDRQGGENGFAQNSANGTGPYRLVSREPDVRTVLALNEDYWGQDEFPLDLTEIVYTPIPHPATRVAAMLSGEVDFIQDLPVQALRKIEAAPGLKVGSAPQNRTIFFGLNVGAEDLASDNVAGRNPLAEPKVRQAMNIAVDRDEIRRGVMQGQSQPAGVIMPRYVNGWTPELDTVPDHDVAAAKALMEEAGYRDGFSIRLDCPNDRYINDTAICEAAVAMLARIGITVNLAVRPGAEHFPLISNGETDFYMLGWGVPTYDSEYIFDFLVHSATDRYGSWNFTGYANPDLDVEIEALAGETDPDARNDAIARIWSVVQDQVIYIPLHNQVLNWGMIDRIDVPVSPDDMPKFKYVQLE